MTEKDLLNTFAREFSLLIENQTNTNEKVWYLSLFKTLRFEPARARQKRVIHRNWEESESKEVESRDRKREREERDT